MPPSSAQPPLDSGRSFEALLRRVLEPRVGDAGLRLDGLVEALLPEGAERLVAGEGVSEYSDDLERLGALPRSATAAPDEPRVSLPLIGISVTPVLRAEATPSLVHITAAVLPTTSASISVAARPLESADSARQVQYETADEGAVRLFLRRVGVTSRKGTLVVAFVPAWTLGASSRLAGLRNRLLKDGRLVRAVEIPDAVGRPGPWAALVLSAPAPDRIATFLRPVRLPRAGDRAQVGLGWIPVPLLATELPWTSRLQVPTEADLALYHLHWLAGGGLRLSELLERRELPPNLDAEYLDRLLAQPPLLRALAEGHLDVHVPIPALAVQREIAQYLRDGEADVYELSCLLQQRDPRDGELLGAFDSSVRVERSMEKVLRLLPGGERLLGWLRPLLGGVEARGDFMAWSNRLYETLTVVAASLTDAQRTKDPGNQIAILSAALARIEGHKPGGLTERLAVEALRKNLRALRDQALGPPRITLEVVSATLRERDTDVDLVLRHGGRSPLFDLALRCTVLGADDAAVLHRVDALNPGDAEHLQLLFGPIPPGERRLEIAWSTRNLVGEELKARVVLPIVITRPKVTPEQLDRFVADQRWDELARLATDEELDPQIVGVIGALVAARRGEPEVAAAALVDAASRGDPDESTSLALLACLMGVPAAAAEIADHAWEREPGDGDIALLQGRMRFWAGKRSAAKAVLYRALEELTTEAHGVLTTVLISEGKTRDAEDQLRGVELDDSLRLSLLPAQVLWGRSEAAEGTLRDLGKFRSITDEDVCWVILDLLHLDEQTWARRLWRLWSWDEGERISRTLLDALIANAERLPGRRDEALCTLFGPNHLFNIDVRRLKPEPPAQNPYVVGVPVRDADLFFGRANELATILRVLTAPHQRGVVLLEGERRTGKTSILHRIRASLPSKVLVVDLNLQALGKISGASAIWRTLGRELHRALGHRPAPGVAPTLPDTYEAVCDAVDEALSGPDWSSLVLLIDEVEVLDAAVLRGAVSDDIAGQLRHLVQTRPVAMVLAGAHALARARHEYRSPLFGFGLRIHVAGLDEQAARALVVRPADTLLRWTDAAVAHVVNLCDRQPFYLQHLCFQVCEARIERPLSRAVTVADVEDVIPRTLVAAEEHLDGLYDVLDQDLTRTVLRRLAASPALDGDGLDRATLAEDVAARLAVAPSSVDEGVAELLERGLIVSSAQDRFRIAVRLLHHRVAQRHPWEDTPC